MTKKRENIFRAVLLATEIVLMAIAIIKKNSEWFVNVSCGVMIVSAIISFKNRKKK